MGFLNGPLPIPFAHRGGTARGHQNSMNAFQYCVDLGYRYLETDVHLSADGVVVASHDGTLERAAGAPGRIRDLTWEQLRAINIDGVAVIPRLDDILDAWPHVYLNIDAKAPGVVEPLAEIVVRRGVANRVCLTSFFDARIARLRALVGGLAVTGIGRRGVALLRAASYAGRPGALLQVPGQCVQVPLTVRGRRLVDERFVDLVHSLGKQLHVWTIDDPDEMSRVITMNVDGIMTNRPRILKQVLTAHDLWPSEV